MEFDEVQRSMEFLLAQQAQFMSDLQQSRELSDRRHAEMSEAIIGLSAIAGMLAESDRQLSRRLAEVAAAQKEAAEVVRELGAAHKELAAAHKDTEASLNALMLTVDRHLREQHGGDGPRAQS